MAIKYLAGERLVGTAAERTALETTTPAAVPQTTWKELTRYTAPSNQTEIEVTFAVKDYLMFLLHKRTTTTADNIMVFGGSDYTSTDYRTRRIHNGRSSGSQSGFTGATTDTNTQVTSWRIANSEGALVGTSFYLYDIWNDANSGAKLGIGHGVYTHGTGTGNECETYETCTSWEPDTASTRIERAKITLDAGSGNFGTGTELVVLGMDVDEADGGGTTNFWQEIASVKGDGSSLTMTTGSITLPKYLMVDIYGEDMVGAKMYFNGETSATEFQRTYTSGGGDYTQNGGTAGMAFLYDLAPAVVHMNIVNVAGEEKLLMFHTTEENNGSTTVRRMEGWAKNTDTDIIDEIQLTKTGSNWTANDSIRIWGHN